MGRSAEEIFTRIYLENEWGDAESRSGPGSTASRTRLVRIGLTSLLRELGIRSLLDLPCGDFNWMRLTELPSVDYAGADVVAELIERNTLLYAKPGRRFLHLDMLRDRLPYADLILCRDALVHFSFTDIAAAFRAVQESGAQYLLTTTFIAHSKNEDIVTGGWRPLNLDLSPLCFPPALRLIEDGPRPDGAYPDKMLALYRVSELPPFDHN